jgi:hypothetical protein
MESRDPEKKDYRKEAMEFWAQARADLNTAGTLMDAGIYYASVFFSQQAAEKALKAALAECHQRSAKGHNLIQFANSLNGGHHECRGRAEPRVPPEPQPGCRRRDPRPPLRPTVRPLPPRLRSGNLDLGEGADLNVSLNHKDTKVTKKDTK